MRVEQLDDWLDVMRPRLARFEDVLMPAGWSGDFSRASLGELERYVLERWPDRVSFDDAGDPDWVDGAVRYVGETYLRVGGGGWRVVSDPSSVFSGLPVIVLDTIDPFPISPFNLLTALLGRRTGQVLAKVYDGQLLEVQERRDVEGPGWEPERHPVPDPS